MRKLICDLCGKEVNNLEEIEVIENVVKNKTGHTYDSPKIEVCFDCKYKYKYERHKALSNVYKKLKKVK